MNEWNNPNVNPNNDNGPSTDPMTNPPKSEASPASPSPSQSVPNQADNPSATPSTSNESYTEGTKNPPSHEQPTYGQGYGNPTYHAPSEHMYSSYNQAPIPEMPKKKKQKAGIGAGAVAVLCVCSLLLSCASGFFGAYLATNMNGTNTPSTITTPSTGEAPTVIYQAVQSPAEGLSSSAGTVSYYNVAGAVKNSVVEITTEFRVDSYFQYVTSGAGSGVIISTDGYIITNNHVIADSSSAGDLADTITVRLTTGEEYPATVIGTDADSDIAVIKIEAPADLPCAVIGNSAELGVGEEVIAVGNPLGELGGTVTNGIISALNREINVDGTTMNLLQTNTAINPGNSGGGLFNMDGELIGVVNAKSSGSDIEGLGFAIPINDAIHVAEELMTQGYVSGRPYLGVEFYNATSMTQALYYGLPGLGVYVSRLEEGFNDKVFEVRDRIIAVDEKEINNFSDISTIIKSHKPGDTIVFSVYRNGKLIEVTATCFEYVPESGKLIEAEGNKS